MDRYKENNQYDEISIHNNGLPVRMNNYHHFKKNYGMDGLAMDGDIKEPPVDYDTSRTNYRQTRERQILKDNISVDSHGKKRTFVRLVSRFAEKTSMQGVPYINNARLTSARYMWVFLLLSAIGAMIFHLYFLFTSFYAWPKITQINLGYNNLQLPAITLCNMNVIKKSELHRASPQLQNLVSFVDPSKFKPDETYGGDQNQGPGPQPGQNQGPNQNPTTRDQMPMTSPDDVTSSFSDQVLNTKPTRTRSTLPRPTTESTNSKMTATVASQETTPTETTNSITDRSSMSTRKPRRRQKRLVNEFDGFNATHYLDSHDNDDTKLDPSGRPKPPRDATSLIENSFEQLYMDHDRNQRIKMGHRIKDMLMRCSFRGRQCYPENFTLFQSPSYGNCYTIQSPDYISRESGRTEGLTLVLFLENMDFIHGITDGYGARFTIHTPDSLPFPIEDGIFIPAYAETQIGLKMVQIERKGKPYGDCNTGIDYENKYNIKYSRRSCMSLCGEFKTIEICGCYSQHWEEYLIQTNNTASKMCKSKEARSCAASVLQQLKEKTLSCDCLSPCQETRYVKTITSRQWPTEEYSMLLLQSVCQRFPHRCKKLLEDQRQLRRLSLNFMKISIYYEDLNYEDIIEKEEIETSQFLSDVGGAVGLWIGLSILSVFEVVQLGAEIIQFLCHKLTRTGRLNDKKPKQNAR